MHDLLWVHMPAAIYGQSRAATDRQVCCQGPLQVENSHLSWNTMQTSMSDGKHILMKNVLSSGSEAEALQGQSP